MNRGQIWEAVGVIFGDGLLPADGIGPAEWIGGARGGEWGTVGALVPNRYESVLRVFPPDSPQDDWWSRYCDLFNAISLIGARHTSTPDRVWFAIWEGHGFERGMREIGSGGTTEARRAFEEKLPEWRAEDRRYNAELEAALEPIPRFELPHRAYYLLHGAANAVNTFTYPGSTGWRNPDLIWPDDRRWFIATDVDFWSFYIGGDEQFITELASSVTTKAERVGFGDRLAIED